MKTLRTHSRTLLIAKRSVAVSFTFSERSHDLRLQTISCLVKSLLYLQHSSFGRSPAALPDPESTLSLLRSYITSLPPLDTIFELSAVLVPPDALDLEGEDGMGAAGPIVEDGQPKPPVKQDVPYVFLSLFPADVSRLSWLSVQTDIL